MAVPESQSPENGHEEEPEWIGRYFGDDPRVESEPLVPLSILTFDEIGNIPVSDNDRILGDHLLDRGSPLVIAGQGGTGKSRLIFQLLAACKRGDPKFLTWDIHPGAASMRWLVLQTENSVRRLQRERERLKRLLGDFWPRFNSDVLVLAPLKEQDSMLNLDDAGNCSRIQAALETFKPDGVISDPLGDLSVGDLNKDVDMRATIVAFSRLCRIGNPNRALIILHHALTGQAGAARSTGYDRTSFARNSKVLFNWTRAQINVAPMSEDNNDQLAVSCGKCSDGKEFQAFGIKLNSETMLYECDDQLDVVEWSKQIKTGKKGDPLMNPTRVRELCEVAGSIKVALAKAIIEDCGCPRQNAYRYIKQAEFSKTVRYSEDQGRYYRN